MIQFPLRLDMKDMPEDKKQALGTLRRALCATFNYCRQYPDKMETFQAVLKYTYNRTVQYQKENKAYRAAIAKRKED